jgi:hypothetical protein
MAGHQVGDAAEVAPADRLTGDDHNEYLVG